MKSQIYFLLTCLLLTINSKVQLFTEEIAEKIFAQNKMYCIYVQTQGQAIYESLFEEFCQDKPCTIINNEVENYEAILRFVGTDAANFFLILDVQNQKKYLLPTQPQVTVKKLQQFTEGFKNKVLQAYYSSEQIPENWNNYKNRKLVGNTMSEFLNYRTPIKVVFLMTYNFQICQNCQKMLEGFQLMANRVTNDDVIIFGHIDILKNDHASIPNEILPHFLIFKANSEKPIQLEGENYEKLYDIVLEAVEEMINPDRKSNQDQDEISSNQSDL